VCIAKKPKKQTMAAAPEEPEPAPDPADTDIGATRNADDERVYGGPDPSFRRDDPSATAPLRAGGGAGLRTM
jgi:hypothetical protein